MICMIHGDNGEPAFWSMVRYGMAIGKDSLYRSMLLKCLGEEDKCIEKPEIMGISRNVTKHCVTVTELVIHMYSKGDDVTLNQLVTLWRAKRDALPW